MRYLTNLLCPALVLAGGLFLTTGCSKEAKIERHLARADEFIDKHDLGRAEIEILNALKRDPDNAQAIANLGLLYYTQGATTRSLPYLAHARELLPDNIRIRSRAAMFRLASGDPAGAKEDATFVLSKDPNEADAAMVLVDLARTPADIQNLSTQLDSLPQTAAVRLAKAVASLKLGRLEAGEAQLKQVIADGVHKDLAYGVLYRLALQRRDLGKAEEYAKLASESSAPYAQPSLLLAKFQLSSGRLEDALKSAQAEIVRAPGNLQAKMMVGEIQGARRDFPAAIRTLEEIIAKDPSNPEATLLRARMLAATGGIEKAITSLEKLISVFPSHAIAHYHLGLFLMQKGESTRAALPLAKALELEPRFTEAGVLLADIKISQNDLSGAIIILNEVLSKNPTAIAPRLSLAEAYKRQNRQDDARDIILKIEAEQPTDPRYPIMRGMFEIQLKNFEAARSAFERAAKVAPAAIEPLEKLTEFSIGEGKPLDAIERVKKFDEANPGKWQVKLLLGRALSANKDLNGAETAYRAAISLEPANLVSYIFLARVYIDSGNTRKALDNLRIVTDKNPKDTGAWMLTGILHELEKQYEEAKVAYERLLTADPKFGPALNNLAYLYAERFNRIDEAHELASRARELAPNDPYAADTLGWVLYRQGKYSWALSLIKEAAEKLPTSGEIQFHLGMTHYRLGDEAAARLAFESALRLEPAFNGRDDASARLALLTSETSSTADLKRLLEQTPDDPIALNRLAAAHIREGRPKDAIELFQKLLKASPDSLVAKRGLARAQLAAKDYAAAIETARDVRKSAKEDGEMAGVLGRAAWATGDRRYAYSMLQEASRRLPDDAGLRTDFAHAAYSQGRVQEALAAAPKLLQSTGDAPTARVAALLDQGRKAADVTNARKALEDALALYPEFTPAMRELAVRLAAAGGDDAKAYEYASKAREADPSDKDLARALGTLAFRRNDWARASTLLAEAATQSADARLHLLLAKSQAQTKGANPKPAAQRALELGLSGSEKGEAETLAR
jgi:tetratricopeptide (TPR) repeat protein